VFDVRLAGLEANGRVPLCGISDQAPDEAAIVLRAILEAADAGIAGRDDFLAPTVEARDAAAIAREVEACGCVAQPDRADIRKGEVSLFVSAVPGQSFRAYAPHPFLLKGVQPDPIFRLAHIRRPSPSDILGQASRRP